MGLFGLGKPKDHDDIDPDYYERRKAYNKAYQEEKVKLATERGRAAAHKKPFYQKLGSAAINLGKSVSVNTKNDPFGMFEGPTRRAAPRRRSTRKAKRKRKKYFSFVEGADFPY